MKTIITQEELAEATGYERPADIRRCLERQGVKVFTGREGRVWTTLGLMEGRSAAHGQAAQQPPAVEFA